MFDLPQPRKLSSWIEGFLELTKHNQSPWIFRKFAAVSTIAGALERKVWSRAAGRTQYPNMFILLAGPPGVGKSDALREVEDFWSVLPELHVASSSLTRASLADQLDEAKRNVLLPGPGTFQQFNALQACVSEFGTFLTQYEGEFMSTMNQLWDCIKYHERKRGAKLDIQIPKPFFNLIAGTTPAWLGSTLPETAWNEGFASRLLLVFSADKAPVNLWTEHLYDQKLKENLEHDLIEIHKMHGQFSWEPQVQTALQTWVSGGMVPAPIHPKLSDYLPRRHVHLIKLMLVMSASRSSELIIRMEDYQEAMSLLLEMEAALPEIFKALKYSSDSGLLDEVYNIVWEFYAKHKKGMPEHVIIQFISERAPSYGVDKIFKVLVDSHMIVPGEIVAGGRPNWKPAPKQGY